MSAPLSILHLGTVPYDVALTLQRSLSEDRRYDRIPDTLLLLEHPHSYTFGRRSRPEHLLLSEYELRERGIAVFEADRGGDITYHGPGQLVGYPILKRTKATTDGVLYLRQLESALVEAVQSLGVQATRKHRMSGVWVGDEKVCAIGVKVDAYGITTHGFALNVNTDIAYFEGIVPCGLRGMGVTSLQREVSRILSMDDIADTVIATVCRTFDCHALSRERAPCSIGGGSTHT